MRLRSRTRGSEGPVVGVETVATLLSPYLTSKQRAIVGLFLNGLICPGVGTLYASAGGRRQGIIQIALAIVALIIIIAAGALLVYGSSLILTLLLMAGGAVVFCATWLWSLISSVQQIRASA